ncbi:hypothetical protein Poly30_32150 [Planctomycetes bacterium Poly30]|uniref:Lipoprotein n=1 Tax=Saltatorellus ferox TaxID=2528018 RepID=A0A518EUB4_9BACT|nr:hypothetical protein Poly30_32150 [Planctomycetes bacterium Poly30]
MQSFTPSIAVALALAALFSCASTGQGQSASIERIRERHAAELDAFHFEQQRLARSEGIRQTLHFGPLGDLIVHDVELIGWPGAETLRSEFTWVNSGVRTRRPPIVQLSIIDEAGDDWRSAEFPLGVTFGIEYGNGSTHSAWLEVPTDGLHLRPNWSWGMQLLAPEDAPGRDRATASAGPSAGSSTGL